MEDPGRRRSHGSWPRDRPIRWGGVAGGLGWLVVSWSALIGQLVLAVPMLVVASDGDGLAGLVLALAWAALTLFTAWSWVLGRWRVVAGPLVTMALLWLAASGR
jgi:hypothetical protein